MATIDNLKEELKEHVIGKRIEQVVYTGVLNEFVFVLNDRTKFIIGIDDKTQSHTIQIQPFTN